MTRGFDIQVDGEGPGIVTLTYEKRSIELRGTEAHKARKQHENFVARFGHNSPEELTWIATRVMQEVAAE